MDDKWQPCTGDFATIPFHLFMFSAAIVELVKSIPFKSIILSSHLFWCLPPLLFPFTLSFRILSLLKAEKFKKNVVLLQVFKSL